MNTVSAAQRFAFLGYYRDALNALGVSSPIRHTPAPLALLRAELLAVLGQTRLSQTIVDELNKSRGLSDVNKSQLELIRAAIAREHGDTQVELEHLRQALVHAERGRSLEYTCQAQLRLLSLLGDQSGPLAIRALVATLRANIIKLGHPPLTAALHVAVAQLEGKRGLILSASRHAHRAQRILEGYEHLWINGCASIVLTGIAILNCEFENALEIGAVALEKSLRCGDIAAVRSCFGNMGHIHMQRGSYDMALDCISKVFDNSTADTYQLLPALYSQAQIYLAKGDFEKSSNLINQIELALTRLHRTGVYDHRHCVHLKAQLLARDSRWMESLDRVDDLCTLSERAKDEYTLLCAKLLKVEVLAHIGRTADAWQLLETVPSIMAGNTQDLLALYERAIACLLVATGDLEAGERHRDRAQRIARSLQNVPASIELERSWESAKRLGPAPPPAAVPGNRPGANVLHGIVALLLYAGRPELLAPELVAVLEHAGVAVGATALARRDGQADELLASFGGAPAGPAVRVFALGTSRQRHIEVRVLPRPDVESLATINSITMLLGTIRDLEQAKAEREERLTLWPSEELPLDNDDAIVTGRMRELMTFARKIAATNVPVLITGESGTGKEVLARAIHAYSPRAKRPFVPLNCTAVPRDLLESQLFGHRRGAFTGADRDHLGVIRAAKDGTLFLDEIGELSLELQPKFLRFLESGEISPLGESSPLTIDVRIVAATNANLEQLVETGKFRDDLFYRLNVVCIAVPPLRERREEIPPLVHHFVAKAAAEFSKGRIRIAEETLEHLQLFSWPGNIRQLQNELRRMVALADADAVLTPAALAAPVRHQTAGAGISPAIARTPAPALSGKLLPAISHIEREMIQAALHANRGRAEATAKALGISRKGLYLKRQRLGI